ncbi:MAG: ABC transporter permease [Dehalococcoidia bacterium]|nr:ABC transporter permease [Dehalococcoidia bacterium]
MATTAPAIPLPGDDAILSVKQRGLWAQAWQRLVRNRLAVVGGALLAVIMLIALLATAVPLVERYDPGETAPRESLQGPSLDHFLGTDNLGRDTWARTWQGLRISLQIGVGTQIIVVTIGVLIGAAAALGGKWTDSLLMRLVDIAYAFPDLLAIIILKAVLSGRGWPIIGDGDPQIPGLSGEVLQVILAISLVGWVTVARLVRGQMLSLKESDYVLAARAIGASQRRIVFTHMLPNTMGPIIVAVTFGIPTAIYAEAVLAIIGFGLEPPTASLGTLVYDGYIYFRANEWLLTVPAASIAILMLCFTFLGDGLRDALDPRTRR